MAADLGYLSSSRFVACGLTAPLQARLRHGGSSSFAQLVFYLRPQFRSRCANAEPPRSLRPLNRHWGECSSPPMHPGTPRICRPSVVMMPRRSRRSASPTQSRNFGCPGVLHDTRRNLRPIARCSRVCRGFAGLEAHTHPFFSEVLVREGGVYPRTFPPLLGCTLLGNAYGHCTFANRPRLAYDPRCAVILLASCRVLSPWPAFHPGPIECYTKCPIDPLSNAQSNATSSITFNEGQMVQRVRYRLYNRAFNPRKVGQPSTRQE